ncbi:hypothetical protein AB4455_02695 [Vibrio sp. 10N.261.46.E12]|uniref:hypothetical protein n=1 Tax=unclassified Vibrio TaxID=2614977 RepID=UPI000975BF35|nr:MULTISPECIES: hypothetical protein [unclassified Vibrio]OMO36625.1 hypothetical protein BH584_25590 [Vibrio sp. 10N.261.45.E1]PMJ33303.1 hypothetical protein BCU27_25020 [Vibrio sp. 10N.286.45.B6]PML83927.1 hypothetical protein BCT66_18375 [Vibrio sp. 10N.261.49.E11]PMM75082.1 hypothetical protein BCT48_25525 [Vibrio sp. 10N.261.46.F12]PMM88911.1 hypothetical protein BCT46_25345 [Vibrio sp. 10N.261.46.E8]
MKTFAQIALATIVFTTSLMAFAEPAATNQAQLEASSTTVKHEGMTVTLTDKHFTSAEETEATASQKLTQSQKADSAPQPTI